MVDTESRAREVLGVADDADWATIRHAYRAEIRLVHPDVTGETTSTRSVELNAAYRLLARVHRSGRARDGGTTATPPPRPAEPASPPPPPPSAPTPAADGSILDNSTIVLTSTPAESFRRLVEAAHTLGEISYIDRSSAIFEAILALEEGIHASLVVSLQWRAHDATCEAFCTLEALERSESLDVSGVLEQLIEALPPDCDGP